MKFDLGAKGEADSEIRITLLFYILITYFREFKNSVALNAVAKVTFTNSWNLEIYNTF